MRKFTISLSVEATSYADVHRMLDAAENTLRGRGGRVHPARIREACPKCGSKRTHRCKTGECRHCDACDHAWL
jgi:hypothetical protein